MRKKQKRTITQLIFEESEKHSLRLNKERAKAHGEVFTPAERVIEVITHLPKESWRKDKTFLDPACGNGQFLAPILIIKKYLRHKNPLETIYGADLLPDNVEECRNRLLAIAGDTPENRKIVENNIRCVNSLEYDFEFESSEKMLDSQPQKMRR